MILNKILKKGNYILGSFLLSSLFVACTDDYFVDENNYRIYVPEIQYRTIQDFYVAFHDAAGNHLRTRRFSGADFDQPYITDGIIRSKLQVGEVNVMCFANLGNIAVTEGKPLADSYLSLPVLDESKHIYAKAPLDCRVFHKVRTVYPIGHPLAQVPDTISMNENRVYMGSIIVKFKNLPTQVKRIEVLYTGLATRMNFDGTMGHFTKSDRVRVPHPVVHSSDGDVSFTDSLLPSAGTLISTEAPTVESSQAERDSLVLEVKLYDNSDKMMGYLTNGDLSDIHDDGQTGHPIVGNISTKGPLYLNPRGTITLIFDNFTLVEIKLSDWGAIVPSRPPDDPNPEITPT